MASIDSEAAIVLNHIPESSTTTAHLADATALTPERVEEAVKRLLALQLIEVNGQTIGITSFAHKARSLFNIVN